MYMQGETIPRESNQVSLSKDLKDPWGIPQLMTSIDYDENADKMVLDFIEQSWEMLEKAGVKNFDSSGFKQAPGLDSLRWAVAGWVIIQKIPCSTNGTRCITAKMFL